MPMAVTQPIASVAFIGHQLFASWHLVREPDEARGWRAAGRPITGGIFSSIAPVKTAGDPFTITQQYSPQAQPPTVRCSPALPSELLALGGKTDF